MTVLFGFVAFLAVMNPPRRALELEPSPSRRIMAVAAVGVLAVLTVIAALSGWGTDGPYANRRVYDSVIQAGSGLAGSQMGLGDDEPAFMRQVAADKITAYTACQAITAALLARERGAGGQLIDLSMIDSVISFDHPATSNTQLNLAFLVQLLALG